MTTRARALLDEALRLSQKERARLAAELLASIDTDSDAAWTEKIEHRAEKAIAGQTTGTPWSVLRKRLVKTAARR